VEDQNRDRPTNPHPLAAAVVVVLQGPEPKHCWREEGPVPLAEAPVRFRRPKRGRPTAEEGLAVGEGTLAAAVAGAAIVRTDWWVGLTPPMLPFPGRRGQQAGRRKDFHTPEEHHSVRLRAGGVPEGRHRGLVFGSARRWVGPGAELHKDSVMDPQTEAVPKVPRHHKGWAMPAEVLDAQPEASPEVGLVPVLRIPQTDRLREPVRVVDAEEEQPGAGRTCPFPCPFVAEEEEPRVVGRTCPPWRPSVVVVAVVDPSCPSVVVAAVEAEKNSSPVCYRCGREAEPGRRQRPIRRGFRDPHSAVQHRVHPRAMRLEHPRQIGQKDCSWLLLQ